MLTGITLLHLADVTNCSLHFRYRAVYLNVDDHFQDLFTLIRMKWKPEIQLLHLTYGHMEQHSSSLDDCLPDHKMHCCPEGSASGHRNCRHANNRLLQIKDRPISEDWQWVIQQMSRQKGLDSDSPCHGLGYLSTFSIQIDDLSTDQSYRAHLYGTGNISFHPSFTRCTVMTNAVVCSVTIPFRSRHRHEVGQVRLIFTGTFAVCSYHVDRSPLFAFTSLLITDMSVKRTVLMLICKERALPIVNSA
ncbi:unnamed protein product [Cercopithifilaria johnstoni]|uniref:Uncharacterized protein n=1 Tax=Cercopithifilaria johnstoni TaxID=2874296 RepID=A0A8J2M455_9BILA|nr:unnamed protein product [Cercopithifilaria johnstoni]